MSHTGMILRFLLVFLYIYIYKGKETTSQCGSLTNSFPILKLILKHCFLPLTIEEYRML